jgi:hypothetical protein
MRLPQQQHNLLDADSTSYKHDALDLVHIKTWRRPNEATAHAHLDLLAPYLLYRAP